MDAKKTLKEFKKKFDKDFIKYLGSKSKQSKKISPYLYEITSNIQELATRGGKRVRPAIMYYSFLGYGGNSISKTDLIRATMSIEISQSYLLIHDDIMDQDDLRRGGKTIHKMYFDKYLKDVSGGNLKNFSNSMAILSGNVASIFSLGVFDEIDISHNIRCRLLNELNNTHLLVNYGQVLDIMSIIDKDFDEKDLLRIHEYKTSTYTFTGPMKMGAILAGKSESEIGKINKYTLPLGIAFQLQDDILGMFGDEEKLGKPVTSDLSEGKKTLLILEALKSCNEKDRKTILSLLGNSRARVSDAEKVKKIIVDTGSLDKSKALAKRYVKKAESGLSELSIKGEGKEFMKAIAEYMIKREY